MVRECSRSRFPISSSESLSLCSEIRNYHSGCQSALHRLIVAIWLIWIESRWKMRAAIAAHSFSTLFSLKTLVAPLEVKKKKKERKKRNSKRKSFYWTSKAMQVNGRSQITSIRNHGGCIRGGNIGRRLKCNWDFYFSEDQKPIYYFRCFEMWCWREINTFRNFIEFLDGFFFSVFFWRAFHSVGCDFTIASSLLGHHDREWLVFVVVVALRPLHRMK